MTSKLRTLRDELNMQFKEREDEIAGSLLALISGEHVLFIGPPGTAKSMLAKDMCNSIDGGTFFYYLLTRFTTPDEIFGPLSLSSLQSDIFSRKVDGYLPTANVSFLDEIFKSNSSILNSLLTILNERKYHNGSAILDVPLFTVFGASNELPEENESLEALYDRFLFRYYVEYVQDESNFVDLITSSQDGFEPSVKLTIDDLCCMKERSADMLMDGDVVDALVALRREFRNTGVIVSDRRWKKIVQVLRVASCALDRKSVDRTMLMLLQHMMWKRPEELATLRKLLLDVAVSGGIDLERSEKDLDDLHASAVLIKDYVLPQPVTCVLCEKQFHRWKELKEHASHNPDHYYILPDGPEHYQLSAVRTSPRHLPNLVEKFASMGKPVTLTMPREQRDLYLGEVEEFEDTLHLLEIDLQAERASLVEKLNENIWLSNKDREDLLDHYDAKTRSMNGMKRMLDDTKNIVVSEDPQTN
jgi:MoxR-like ATPase